MSKILEEAAELEQKTEPVSGTKDSLIAESDERNVSGFKPAGSVLAYEEVAAPKQKPEPISGMENSPIAESDERVVSGFKPAGMENYHSQVQGAERVQLQAAELHVKIVKKNNRKAVLIAFAALIVAAGLGVAAYSLGASGSSGRPEKSGVKNKTDIPEGALVPAFSPIDPADFAAAADENFIVVPDETGLELPAFGHGPQISAEPMNHYTQTPNVSTYFTRAAQDESYVYFLQGPPSGKYGLYNLARANISTGKTDAIANANEYDSRIYSFVLYEKNIITCEYKQSTDSFAFYRVPKSFEDAQLLFETKSPAYMNVFDNKIFMLFVDEQALGVFDLKTDTQPSYIALERSDDTAHYFPQFSVVNGYLHYGIWYETDAGAEDSADDNTDDADVTDDNASNSGEQARMEYLRRSLYTGETVTLLSVTDDDVIWNPCWDDNGNAYYAQYNSEAMEFHLMAVKDNDKPQSISVFDNDGLWPLIAFKDEFLVLVQFPDNLRQYDPADFSVKHEVTAESQPFAATKDFLVAEDGMYRLFDFGFIEFE